MNICLRAMARSMYVYGGEFGWSIYLALQLNMGLMTLFKMTKICHVI